MPRVIGAPTDLAGCLLWLDASDSASVIRDGSNVVSQWSDKSGNANHATEANPTNRPTYGATAFGGLPGIDWGNGSVIARALTTPGISYGIFTAFIVFRGDASSGYVYVHESDNGGNREYIHGDPNPNINVRRGGVQSMRAVVLPFQSATGVVNRDGQRRILTRRYGGTHATNTIRVDGATPQTNVISGQFFDPGTAASAGAVYIGNRQSFDNPARGVFAEVIIFNRYMNDGEVARVEQYLSRKWKIALETLRIASPLEIPDCAMWLDAAQGVTLDGSSKVSQWDDSSGNARHIAQAVEGNRPGFTAANPLFGNQPTVDFGATGLAHYLDRLAADNFAQPLTILSCFNLLDTSSANMSLFNVTSGAGCTLSRPNATSWRFYGGLIVDFPKPPDPSKAMVFAGVYNGAFSNARLRGVTVESSRNAGAVGIATFRLGSFNDPSAALNWHGAIAEFLIYRRRLFDGEIAVAEAYLKRKYAL